MLVITRHNKHEYSLSDGKTLLTDQSVFQVSSMCTHKYKIKFELLKSAMKFCKASNSDMIIFHSTTEYTLRKIDYSNMLCTDTSSYLK